MEYVGEVLSKRQFHDRVREAEDSQQQHFYFMTLKHGQVIDASHMGNLARFMNHSCNPNCEAQKWTVNGQLRVGLFARKSIRAATELTFDYKFVRFGQKAQECYCGEECCKGIIGEQAKEPMELLNDSGSESPEDDEEAEIHRLITDPNSMLHSPEQVPLLVKGLLRCNSAKNAIDYVNVLLRTNSIDCFKQFLHFHGLKVISTFATDMKSLGTIGQEVLCQLLLSLPLTNKRQVVEISLDSVITDNDDLKELVEHVRRKFASLSDAYHIPRLSSASNLHLQAKDAYSLEAPEEFKRPTSAIISSFIPESSPRQSRFDQRGDRSVRKRRSRSPPIRDRIDRDYRQASMLPQSMQLPPNWKAAVAQDGQTYYYHEISKETRWDLPASSSPSAFPTLEQACRIVDGSMAIARSGKAIDSRTRLALAEGILKEFKNATYTDLTEGKYKALVDRFISDRLYRSSQSR